MGQQRTHLEISTMVLVVYTSLIVGIAEGYVFPFAITPVVITVSVLLSRYWDFLRFNTLTSNVLGILAFLLAAAELFSGNIEARLLAGVHLMVYLTWIVVLQRRQLTHYWWLVALCVLQAAIGAILMNSALYGVFLLVFLFLAMWTMALFSLHRSQSRFLQWSEARDLESETLKQATMPPVRTTLERPVSQPGFGMLLLAPSSAKGAMQLDQSDRWLTTRFVVGIFGLTMASACVALIFFGLIPRQWIGSQSWGGIGDSSLARANLVGFSEEVSLDSYGTMLESTQRVFEVRVIDGSANRIAVEDYARQLGQPEPLFRGQILDNYEDGSWSRHESTVSEMPIRSDTQHNVPRQEYRIAAIGSRTLFLMQSIPPGKVFARWRSEHRRSLSVDPIGSVLLRSERTRSLREFHYEVYVPSSLNERSIQWSPPVNLTISDADLRSRLQRFLREDVEIRSTDSPRQRADQIVRFLRDSEKYRYSLTIPRRQSLDKDPVLEFLEDRRTGHCQYFATALALLLRADGIPSRIVTGFKGGEENTLTGYFDVQQRHAHAWVEAHIDSQWVTLDATPAERAEAVAQTGSWFDAWKSFFKDFWSHYIIELEYNDQKKLVYDPLMATASDAWSAASLKQSATSSRWQALKEFLSNPSRWFSWQGGLFSFVIMLLIAGVVWTAKRTAGLLRRLRDDIGTVHKSVRRIEFYERFVRLCESLGQKRRPAQTQREFAETVAKEFAARLPKPAGPDLPAEITGMFYDVRFGSRELTSEQGSEIDAKLRLLEESLQPAKSG